MTQQQNNFQGDDVSSTVVPEPESQIPVSTPSTVPPPVIPPPVIPPSIVPPPVTSVTPTNLPTRLTDSEVQALERQNNRRQLLKSIAEKAASDAEVAELTYKNMIMQFFMQYGLTKLDSIGQDGTIMRGNVNVNATK